MAAHSFLKFLTRGRCWCFCLLLQIPVLPLCAAEKRLTPGHVPAAVARGNLAPLGRVPGTNRMHLALGLPLRNAEALTNLLAAIYQPASAEFHRYLTPKEFAARFGPTPADYAAVIRFAQTNGLTVTATHPNRLLVDVTGKVSDVERALHVRLNSFRHPQENRNFFAPDTEPTVAATVPVFHVSGLDDFSRPHPNLHWRPITATAKATPQGGSGPNGTFMGDDFRQGYVPGTPLTGAGQNVGLLEFEGFYASDITNYANMIGLTNLPQLVSVPVDGGPDFSDPNGIIEVALDLEMVLALSPGVLNICVYEAPNTSPWVDLLSRMANDNVANQLSCSWSGGNPDPAAEQIFQQMAVQGQSFFNATGDTDAFNGAIPFPSESPNITEVGGTFLVTDINGNYSAESVWNRGGDVGGSGGISPAVAIPVWQLGLDMTTNHGSTYFRNIPDVALTADNVYVFAFNQGGGVGGTSCAAPLWAAFTALINQQAAQLGQPPVGFLNPALYALCRGTNYATTFHDITTGNNTNTNSPLNFFAVPGFDLCTGWGTPAGTNLINALTMPDNLGVMPPTSFAASGLVGGPFTPTNWSVVLTNSGADSLAWSLGDALAWLTISTSNGTLAAHGTTNITLQLVNANGLSAGSYLAALLVTNQSLSHVHAVEVQLDIGPPVAFVSFSAGTDAFQLAWNSLAGLNYQVQCKTNLAQAGWLDLGTVAATTNITMFEDTNAVGGTGQRFYRLVWP